MKTINIRIPYKKNILKISGDDTEGLLELAEPTQSFSFYLQKYVIDLCLSKDKPCKILNAGANLGLVALPLSFFCDEIFAIEPIPFIYKHLQYNIYQNKINNIKTINYALSNICGTVSMEPYGWDKSNKDSGHSVVTDRLYNDDVLYIPDDAMTITSKTIDSLGIGNIDILLLDVEGFETYVIEGAIQTIKDYKPYIIIEHEIGHIKCRQLTSKKIINYIMNLGYHQPNVIIPNLNDNDNYDLLPISSLNRDFLEILSIYPCVDLVFSPK